MSERDKEPEEIWSILEEQAAEDRLEEVAQMSDAELAEKLRAAGFEDPAAVAEEGLRAARAGAAEPLPGATKLSVVQGGARDTAPVKRQPSARRIPRRWLGLAAAAVLVLVPTMAWQGPALVAWWKGETPHEAPRQPTPQELAETARRAAFAACDLGEWEACEKKLDEAQKLDPASEWDPRVHVARDAVYAGLHPDAGLQQAKPGPRP